MKTVGSFEAKTHLPEILKRAQAGETIIVTRHGQPVAQIGPVTESRLSPKEVMRRLRALRLKIPVSSMSELRDEGRRT